MLCGLCSPAVHSLCAAYRRRLAVLAFKSEAPNRKQEINSQAQNAQIQNGHANGGWERSATTRAQWLALGVRMSVWRAGSRVAPEPRDSTSLLVGCGSNREHPPLAGRFRRPAETTTRAPSFQLPAPNASLHAPCSLLPAPLAPTPLRGSVSECGGSDAAFNHQPTARKPSTPPNGPPTASRRYGRIPFCATGGLGPPTEHTDRFRDRGRDREVKWRAVFPKAALRLSWAEILPPRWGGHR